MKKDLRVVKTEKLINASFISLLKEKPFAKVTVGDIAERAEINRNTFYLHYTDKEDLLNKIVSEVLYDAKQQIERVVCNFTSSSETEYRKYIEEALRYIEKNYDFFKILLNDDSLNHIVNALVADVKERLTEKMKFKQNFERIVFDCVFYGMFGVIKEWIISDIGTVEELSLTLSKVLYAYIGFFIK